VRAESEFRPRAPALFLPPALTKRPAV